MTILARFFLTAIVALTLLAATGHRFPASYSTLTPSPQRLLVEEGGAPVPLPPLPPPAAC